MPEFHRHEKRVGLHSAVFRKSALQANGFWLASPRKPARTAKVRLVVARMFVSAESAALWASAIRKVFASVCAAFLARTGAHVSATEQMAAGALAGRVMASATSPAFGTPTPG